MKLLSTLTRTMRRTIAVGVLAASFAGFGLFAASHVGAADCDDNAVIRCGVGSVSDVKDKYASNKSVRQIFNCMDISKSDVDNMHKGLDSNQTGVVAGTVTKDGKVIVNGDVVATNAKTGGRQNMPGSTDRTNDCGTPFFERTPSVSFQQSSLPALVDMQNGKFQFAIINSCGNPVVATAKTQPQQQPKTPAYTINKTVAQKGSNNFVKSLSGLTPGTHVIYRVTVKSTGDAAVQNLKVNDVLPSHVKYVSGTLTRDGNSASSSAFFGNGVVVNSLAPGTSTVFQFEAIVGPNDTPGTCTTATLTNTGKMTATSLSPKSSTATVSEKCTAPVCTNLNISASSDRTVKVTEFSYKSNGATFNSADLNWGDQTKHTIVNSTSQVIGQTHKFAKDGTYTVGVTVNFTLQNGQKVAATGPNCQKTVVFTPGQPPKVTTPPSQLTNTGPGSVAALFAAVSVIGALAHRLFLVRRVNS